MNYFSLIVCWLIVFDDFISPLNLEMHSCQDLPSQVEFCLLFIA